MTLLNPALRVNRLVVFQGWHTAFDCPFHSGVNVIRGRNSSGKTTIMDLLAFSLGAENIRWKPEALQCSQTIVEVQLNEGVACLARDISDQAQRPMSIYWGNFDEAIKAGPNRWERYSFKRSEHQFSFSQVIFNALEMPVAQGDGSSNLTIHQILRVLYADQPSIHSPIFRDDIFDSALTREVVGGYLFGVYDDELYSSQLKIRELEAQLSKYVSELRGIFKVLGRSGLSPDLTFSNEKIKELEDSRDKITKEVVRIKTERSLPRKDANQARSKADNLRVELSVAHKKASELKDEYSEIQLDMHDSILFVRELEERLANLDESQEARSYFGNVQFKFCPSCLSELDVRQSSVHHCNLCSAELGEGRGGAQILRMRNEINIQLKESKSLIDSRSTKSEQLRRDIPLMTEKIKSLSKEYARVASSWSSEMEIVLEEMSHKLGLIEGELRQAHEHQKLASVIADLQVRRDKANSELAKLQERTEALKVKQEARQREVERTVEGAMIRLLKEDLHLQPEFSNAKSAKFSFENNTVWVNNTRYFSESSAVVLRHIFHLALLTASVKKEYMRLPRFMILDGIDDGGMEKERSHNLQEIIVRECESYEADYQLIFATSEIHPELEGSDLVVGQSFSPQKRSLDVRDV